METKICWSKYSIWKTFILIKTKTFISLILALQWLSRNDLHSICSSHGDKLLNLCKKNLNLKHGSQREAAYSMNGVRTIDYTIIEFFSNINYFIAEQSTPLSNLMARRDWRGLRASKERCFVPNPFCLLPLNAYYVG